MELEIRPLRESDYPSWTQLFDAYLEFYEASFSVEMKQEVWRKLVAKEFGALGAVFDGKLVGFAHFHLQLSTWAPKGHLYLEDLYVHPDYRGQGFANSLIGHIKEIAISRGCGEMYWITKSSNTTARILYDKVADLSEFVRYEIQLKT